jgi:anaerobic magnesium-protoporphyrin IX monomethyl ester cyclase
MAGHIVGCRALFDHPECLGVGCFDSHQHAIDARLFIQMQNIGFEEERFETHWNALWQLLYYDPDLLNAMYVTPHRWTSFYGDNQERAVIEGDQAKWDYRHQVLGTRYLRPWQIFLMVKATELIIQLRPRALWRLLFYQDGAQRRAYRWCFRNAGFVWLSEIFEFFFQSSRLKEKRSLEDHAGAQLTYEAPLISSQSASTPFHRGEGASG